MKRVIAPLWLLSLLAILHSFAFDTLARAEPELLRAEGTKSARQNRVTFNLSEAQVYAGITYGSPVNEVNGEEDRIEVNAHRFCRYRGSAQAVSAVLKRFTQGVCSSSGENCRFEVVKIDKGLKPYRQHVWGKFNQHGWPLLEVLEIMRVTYTRVLPRTFASVTCADQEDELSAFKFHEPYDD